MVQAVLFIIEDLRFRGRVPLTRIPAHKSPSFGLVRMCLYCSAAAHLELVLISVIYQFFRKRKAWKRQRHEQVTMGSSQGVCCWWALGPILLLAVSPFALLSPCKRQVPEDPPMRGFRETTQLNYSTLRYLCVCV